MSSRTARAAHWLAVALALAGCGDGGESSITFFLPGGFTSNFAPSGDELLFDVEPSSILGSPVAKDVEASIRVAPEGSPDQLVTGRFSWVVPDGGGARLVFKPDPLPNDTVFSVSVVPTGAFHPMQTFAPTVFATGHRLAVQRVLLLGLDVLSELYVTLSEPANPASVAAGLHLYDEAGHPLAVDVATTADVYPVEYDVRLHSPPPATATVVLQIGPGITAQFGTPPLVPAAETWGATPTGDGGLSVTLRPADLTDGTWSAHL